MDISIFESLPDAIADKDLVRMSTGGEEWHLYKSQAPASLVAGC